jgi:hypothetical protein
MGPRARDGRWRRPTRGAAGTRAQAADGRRMGGPGALGRQRLASRRRYGSSHEAVVWDRPPSRLARSRPRAAETILRDMFVHPKEKFGAAPLDWYLDNLPQILAEELTMRVSAEFAAILGTRSKDRSRWLAASA